jgi:hypothetical protein
MFGTDNSAPSLLFGEFSLHFPSLRGETGSRRAASTATRGLMDREQGHVL